MESAGRAATMPTRGSTGASSTCRQACRVCACVAPGTPVNTPDRQGLAPLLLRIRCRHYFGWLRLLLAGGSCEGEVAMGRFEFLGGCVAERAREGGLDGCGWCQSRTAGRQVRVALGWNPGCLADDPELRTRPYANQPRSPMTHRGIRGRRSSIPE